LFSQISLRNGHQSEQMVTQREIVPVHRSSPVIPYFKSVFRSKENDWLRLKTLLQSLLLCN